MKKTLKRILVCLMCIVMFQTAFIPTKIQAAAVKLNKTSVTLATGKNYTLKLQGTKQKPTWKSSNTRICVFRWKSYRTEDRKGNDHSESWKEKL